MNWILVVLQATAAVGTPAVNHQYYGWQTVGEFATHKACIDASVTLAQATQRVGGVKNFQCLSKL